MKGLADMCEDVIKVEHPVFVELKQVAAVLKSGKAVLEKQCNIALDLLAACDGPKEDHQIKINMALDYIARLRDMAVSVEKMEPERATKEMVQHYTTEKGKTEVLVEGLKKLNKTLKAL